MSHKDIVVQVNSVVFYSHRFKVINFERIIYHRSPKVIPFSVELHQARTIARVELTKCVDLNDKAIANLDHLRSIIISLVKIEALAPVILRK